MGLSRLGIVTRTVRPQCTLREASHLMIEDSIGALLLTDTPGGEIRGIVTDRDIVRRIAKGADPATEILGSFAEQVVTTIHEGATRAEAIHKFKTHGIRRLPVVDDAGGLSGIISLDDVLVELGDEMSDVASTIRSQFRHQPPESER